MLNSIQQNYKTNSVCFRSKTSGTFKKSLKQCDWKKISLTAAPVLAYFGIKKQNKTQETTTPANLHTQFKRLKELKLECEKYKSLEQDIPQEILDELSAIEAACNEYIIRKMDDYFIYGATIPNITEEEIDKLKDIIAESYAENENIIINNDFLNNKIETMREQEGLSQKEQEPEEAQKVTKTIQELKQDQLARTQKKDVVKEEIFEKIIDYFLNLPKDDRVIDGQKLIDMFIKESDTEGILTVDDKLEILEGFANYARAELDKSQLRNLIIQKQEQQRKTLTWDDAIEILSEQEKAKESTKMRKHFYKQALHNIIHNDAEQSVIRERQEYINKLNVEEKLLKLGYAKEDLSKMGPIGMLLTLAKLGDKWSIHELAKNSDKYIKLLEQERKMGRVTPDEEDLILKLSEYRQQI